MVGLEVMQAAKVSNKEFDCDMKLVSSISRKVMNLTDHSAQANEDVVLNNETTNDLNSDSSTVSPSPILGRINNYSSSTLEPNIINLPEQPCTSANEPKEPKVTPPERKQPRHNLQVKSSQLSRRILQDQQRTEVPRRKISEVKAHLPVILDNGTTPYSHLELSQPLH
jgi:hypothetical protein